MIRIEFNGVQHSGGVYAAEMTVSDGTAAEQVLVPLTKETAALLKAVLEEEPFRVTKPGSYRREFSEIRQGGGHPKTLIIQVSKGRSRTKRSVAINDELFLMLWNLLRSQVLPSQLTTKIQRT